MQVIHAKQALTPDGWAFDREICIGDDGLIAAVRDRQQPSDHTVDLALPAPSNLHSHAFQRAMSGLTESRGPLGHDSFWSWRRLMYRFLDQLTPDDVRVITSLAFMEMMEAGYAAVGEFHYLHHAPGGTPYANPSEMSGQIIEAARAIGIGLTHLPVLYQFGGCDRRPLEGGQRRFGCDLDQFGYLWSAAEKAVLGGERDYAVGVAPHSLRAVDQDGLSACIAMAASSPIHMHLSEQVAEVDEVLAHLGSRPVDWLLDRYRVGPNWSLIHCTHMMPGETQKLARTGAVAGLCPITESSLGDGIFDGVAYTDYGGELGVGSDSNIHVSFFEELCTLEYSQRLRDRGRVAMATPTQSVGRFLFEKAARGGAQAIARNAGVIRPGSLADILGVSTDNPWLCNRRGDAVLDGLVFCGRARDCIRDVWSAGRHQVRDGRHVLRDRIVLDFMQTMAGLDQGGVG